MLSAASCAEEDVKGTPQSDQSRGSLAITFPPPETFSAGTRVPLQRRLQCPNGPCWTPHSPQSHAQALCPPRFQPRFPVVESQMSPSIKPFLSGTVTQKQPELFPRQRNLSVLFPHSLRAQGSSLAFSGALGSCRVSQCPSPSCASALGALCCALLAVHGLLSRAAPGTELSPSHLHLCVHNQEEGRVGVRWFQFCLCYSPCRSIGNCQESKAIVPKRNLVCP